MTADPIHFPPFRFAPLAATHAVAIGAGVLLGGGLSALSGQDQGGVVTASVFAAVVWVIAAGVGLGTLAALTGGRSERLAFPLLVISFGRMLLGIMLAVALYFLLEPAGRPFWTCFLLAGLASLAGETAWAMRTLNPTRARPAGAGHDGAA